MSLNKLMHPRNIYKVPPDFKELAIKYPQFRKQVSQDLSGKINLDFKDPNTLRALTSTLLKHDFGLDVVIPPSHLVPTVPQRLNYILWVEDLLTLLSLSSGTIRGIDIGTGACCIYPLLGSKKNGWRFLASEINDESVSSARDNVNRNNLGDKIEVLKVEPSSTLEALLEGREDTYHFCMCNPPFFQDKHDANWKKKARTPRRTEPNAAKTGEDEEMIVEGGEVEFVKAIIQSSLKLKEKIKIYTTMLGKKRSVKEITDELLNCKISCFTTAEFCQGKTMRWGVAWTFAEGIPLKPIQHKKPHNKAKPPLVYIIPSNITKTEYSLKALRGKIMDELQELKVQVKVMSENENSTHLHLRSDQNTWSHQRRKRREIKRQMTTEASSNSSNCNHNNNDEIVSLPSTSAEGCSLNKREVEESQLEPQKRRKGNDAEQRGNETKDWLLSCDLALKQIGKNVALQMNCCRDMESREPMHQIMQFLKNNIK